LSSLAYGRLQVLGADVGNLRVSSSAVELDLLLNSQDDMDLALKVLEEQIGPKLTIRQLDLRNAQLESAEAIRLGIGLFNEERYWESHEALEEAWRPSTGPEKEILQGIILLAAAFVHLQKDEPAIALSVMKRGYERLSQHSGEHFRVDISALNETVASMLRAGRLEFFKIATIS
jgi:predicted metal-dependent hydrolase